MFIICNNKNEVLINHCINDLNTAERMVSDYKKMFPKREVTIFELKEVN